MAASVNWSPRNKPSLTSVKITPKNRIESLKKKGKVVKEELLAIDASNEGLDSKFLIKQTYSQKCGKIKKILACFSALLLLPLMSSHVRNAIMGKKITHVFSKSNVETRGAIHKLDLRYAQWFCREDVTDSSIKRNSNYQETLIREQYSMFLIGWNQASQPKEKLELLTKFLDYQEKINSNAYDSYCPQIKPLHSRPCDLEIAKKAQELLLSNLKSLDQRDETDVGVWNIIKQIYFPSLRHTEQGRIELDKMFDEIQKISETHKREYEEDFYRPIC